MAAYSTSRISALHALSIDKTRSTTVRGRAFEDWFCYLLDQVPGFRTRKDTLNKFHSEEIDIAVANSKLSDMGCFPNLFLVECKNWSDPVDSPTVGAFIDKLANRRIELGVLVAANGVTGDENELTAVYHKASLAQVRGHRLIVITLDELLKVTTTQELTTLLIEKLLDVIASGTFRLS
ncbi:hypothetical protein GCM10023088_07930 [Actinomadura verrucosospora]|uniref:restriction endonuclease n=1 Tax=Actinomadura verrucosospora TaxID=46165 RepID=UPI0031E8C11B